eukprot:gene17575-biopygen13252
MQRKPIGGSAEAVAVNRYANRGRHGRAAKDAEAMLRWLWSKATEGGARHREQWTQIAKGAEVSERIDNGEGAEYAADADEVESCGKVRKTRQSAGRPWKAQNMQKVGVVGEDVEVADSSLDHGRPWKTWEAHKMPEAAEDAEDDWGRWKAGEGRGRLTKAATGRRKQWKAVEGNGKRGRPRKAAEGAEDAEDGFLGNHRRRRSFRPVEKTGILKGPSRFAF